jgi:choline/glycine/proline betaine transport protein
MNNPGSAIYLFLEGVPWFGLTAVVVTILAIVFFVTSGDSGSLVLSNLTSVLTDPNHDAPSWMRITWAAIIGLLTLALLLAGGLGALQSTVVIMGLPFAFVLFAMMAGLYRALKVEGLKEDSHRNSMAGQLSGRIAPGETAAGNWRQRLLRAMTFPDQRQAVRFLRETGRPAMNQIASVLEEKGYRAEIGGGTGGATPNEDHLALNVPLGDEQDFTYQIWPLPCAMPAFSVRDTHAGTRYYRLEVHINEGSQGYDVYGYTQGQLIADILDQFERHLHFLHAQRETPGRNAIMPDDPATAGR